MILLGDARQMGLADNSIDAIVTDPPYGLEFMNKDWDRLGDLGKARAGFSKGAPAVKGVRGEIKALPSYNAAGNIRCRKCDKWKWGHKPGDGGGGGLGCQCKEPDFPNVKAIQAKWMQAWHHSWATEALRVLKPGGHLLAMGGTRTFHRLTCALEDAGFEIRDTIMWLYGSGFPKSYNLSKGFDRRAFKAWLDTVELDCCLVRDPCARKAQIRKAVSAAVGGVYSDISPGLRSPEGYLRSGGQNTRPWLEDRKAGKANEGSRLLASLITRFWEPLNEIERYGIWQGIIGDHEDCDVGMPPGVREKTGKSSSHCDGRSQNKARNSLEWSKMPDEPDIRNVTAPSTPLAKEWEGFGSGLKPAFEPVVVARKPLIGTLCENAEKWGAGGLNIDECRIGTEVRVDSAQRKQGPYTDERTWAVSNTPPRSEPRAYQGRWPANLILSHSKDCVRVGTKRVRGHRGYPNGPGGKSMHYSDQESRGQEVRPNAWPGHADPDGYEQVEGWICVKSCPVKLLDEQGGERPGGRPITNPESDPTNVVYHKYPNRSLAGSGRQDRGGASRFYKNIKPDNPLRFCYTAKSSRAERTCQGTVENKEPTVKPVNLCRYLERLVARPGAVILDPFCGSGSFGVGAALEGFSWIGIDNRLEACQIAKKRCEWAEEEGQPRLFK